jgi:hypothetical protein
MKTAKIWILVAMFAAGVAHAQAPDSSSPTAALTDLVSGSRWTWWEGNFDRYEKGKMQYWVEFYKDGTARVPWRDHAQYWKITEPNVLTLSGAGLNPDKHIFVMDLGHKSGSRENQSLHIRYEKRASKPARWK